MLVGIVVLLLLLACIAQSASNQIAASLNNDSAVVLVNCTQNRVLFWNRDEFEQLNVTEDRRHCRQTELREICEKVMDVDKLFKNGSTVNHTLTMFTCVELQQSAAIKPMRVPPKCAQNQLAGWYLCGNETFWKLEIAKICQNAVSYALANRCVVPGAAETNFNAVTYVCCDEGIEEERRPSHDPDFQRKVTTSKVAFHTAFTLIKELYRIKKIIYILDNDGNATMPHEWSTYHGRRNSSIPEDDKLIAALEPWIEDIAERHKVVSLGKTWFYSAIYRPEVLSRAEGKQQVAVALHKTAHYRNARILSDLCTMAAHEIKKMQNETNWLNPAYREVFISQLSTDPISELLARDAYGPQKMLIRFPDLRRFADQLWYEIRLNSTWGVRIERLATMLRKPDGERQLYVDYFRMFDKVETEIANCKPTGTNQEEINENEAKSSLFATISSIVALWIGGGLSAIIMQILMKKTKERKVFYFVRFSNNSDDS